MEFEYVSQTVDYKMQSEVNFENLDGDESEVVNLNFEARIEIRPHHIRSISFYVPNQTIVLSSGKKLEVKDVESIDDDLIDGLDKIGIRDLSLEGGKFKAQL